MEEETQTRAPLVRVNDTTTRSPSLMISIPILFRRQSFLQTKLLMVLEEPSASTWFVITSQKQGAELLSLPIKKHNNSNPPPHQDPGRGSPARSALRDDDASPKSKWNDSDNTTTTTIYLTTLLMLLGHDSKSFAMSLLDLHENLPRTAGRSALPCAILALGLNSSLQQQNCIRLYD